MRLLDEIKSAPLKWRNPYDEEENKRYDDLTAIHFTEDDGKTLQAPAEEQDINVIMKRFGVKDGSVLPYWTDPQMIFGDFTSMPTDPVEAAEMIRQGNIAFMQLPANIRSRFQSGPELFNWLKQRANEDEAIKLGLLTPAKQAEPVSTNTSSVKEPLVTGETTP